MKNPPPKPHRRYTVIVDPGHGGHDTGALDPSRRYREKDAVLQIALRLRRQLRKLGFRVIMTRSSDRFIKLRRRTHFANLKHGDVFVSIHANAVGRLSRAGTAHGIETYFLSPARSERARRVAAKENSIAFIRRDSKTMNSFISTLTRSKIILSNMLALDVQRNILGTLRQRYRNVADGGVRAAPFWVLVGAEMPAILVETGYITNPWEKKRLFNPRYQEMEAQGIAQGILRFLHNREREME
jgi:N-acetylmuramoyl-L-alanine amidase